MSERRNKIGTWIGFIIILVWCLLPVVWIMSLSFKGPGETATGSPQFLPQHWTIQNYRDVLGFGSVTPGQENTNNDFLAALRNSAGIAAISTLLSVIFATLAAYAIALFPVVALVGPLFDLWRTLHLFNTWPGLIIPYMSFTLPLAIWTLSAFL